MGCNKKITNLTNWKPDIDLMSGVEKTIQWFSDHNNLKNYKIDEYNK